MLRCHLSRAESWAVGGGRFVFSETGKGGQILWATSKCEEMCGDI